MSNGFLRSLLVLVGEDVADGREFAGRMYVREAANVAVHRVGSVGAAREAFSRSDIRVIVVGEQHVARCLEVRRPVLGLTVGSHHAVVAADAEVVLRRNATGVVEGLLAGEHHRAVRRHDQNALGVHQHRRFGVPIRLRADVDSRDDDVDLTAVLGERDDSAQRARHPVHVLGATLHRNGGAGGQGEPLDRRRQLFGEIERRDHAGAFGFGHRAQRFRRVTEQGDAGHALGVAGRRPRHHADDEAGGVAPIRTVHRYQRAGLVEVVFDEAALGAGETWDQLVRVDQAAGLRTLHLLRVLVERAQRLGRRRRHIRDDAGARSVGEANRHPAGLRRLVVLDACQDGDLLQPRIDRQRRYASPDRRETIGGDVEHRPHVKRDAVVVEPLLAPLGLRAANAVETRLRGCARSPGPRPPRRTRCAGWSRHEPRPAR